ncbi:hypothetical protein ACRALDRAFT_208816 [Sodiomyces alcalophilus JCM 7366]|uniref:uncharacterized protein n=1 Tax=Sodiomyces alcalophilus JCM 7366 TaxID=591952 RepID=UPI0039B47018
MYIPTYCICYDMMEVNRIQATTISGGVHAWPEGETRVVRYIRASVAWPLGKNSDHNRFWLNGKWIAVYSRKRSTASWAMARTAWITDETNILPRKRDEGKKRIMTSVGVIATSCSMQLPTLCSQQTSHSGNHDELIVLRIEYCEATGERVPCHSLSCTPKRAKYQSGDYSVETAVSGSRSLVAPAHIPMKPAKFMIFLSGQEYPTLSIWYLTLSTRPSHPVLVIMDAVCEENTTSALVLRNQILDLITSVLSRPVEAQAMDRENSARNYHRHKRHGRDHRKHSDKTPRRNPSHGNPGPDRDDSRRYGTDQSQDFVWKWLEGTNRRHERSSLQARDDRTDDRIPRCRSPQPDESQPEVPLATTNPSGKRPRSPHADIFDDYHVDCRHGSMDTKKIARPMSRFDLVDSDQESYSPPLNFEKRPRHKTREDKYERGKKPVGSRKHSESAKPRNPKRRKEVSKKQLASRREVMDNFASETVRVENNSATLLTPDQLHPGTIPGIFQNGFTSSKNHTEDLAHVKMDWKPQLHRHQNMTRRSSKSRDDRERKRRERELEDMDAYYGPRDLSKLKRGRTRHANSESDASFDHDFIPASEMTPNDCGKLSPERTHSSLEIRRRPDSAYSRATTSHHCRSLSQPSHHRRQGKHGRGVSAREWGGDLDAGHDLQSTGVAVGEVNRQYKRGLHSSGHSNASVGLNCAGDTAQRSATPRPTIIRYVDKGVTATAESIDCCKATGEGPPDIEHENRPALWGSGLHSASSCLPGPSIPPETIEQDDTGHTRNTEQSNQQSTTEEAQVRETMARRAYIETPGTSRVPAPSSLDPGRIHWTLGEDHMGEAAERTNDASYISWPKRSSAMQRISPPENQHSQYSCAANQNENSLPPGDIAGTTGVHLGVPEQRPSTPRPECANAMDHQLKSVGCLARPTDVWFPQDATMRCTEQPELCLSRELSLRGPGDMYVSAAEGADDDISRLDREVLHEYVVQSQKGDPVSSATAATKYNGHFPQSSLQDRFAGQENYEAEADDPFGREIDKRRRFASQPELEISADAILERHGLAPWSSLNTDDRRLRMATFWRPNPLI